MACGRSRVRSSSPATFFRGDWSWNHFYGHSFPSTISSSAVVNYWRNDVHLVLVSRLERLPRNSVVSLTDSLDMSIVVDWDVKPQIKQNKKFKLLMFFEMISRVFAEYLREISRRNSAKVRGVSHSARVRGVSHSAKVLEVSPRVLAEKKNGLRELT